MNTQKSDVTFALTESGDVEWYYPKNRPDLTADEAMVVGINRAARALSDIAGALREVAMALDRIADAS